MTRTLRATSHSRTSTTCWARRTPKVLLLANAGDKTLVRNALTKEIGDAVGLPFTPGYCFVDLVLNGKYVGTYQVTEYLEADANRVNVDEDNGLLIQMTGSTPRTTS